MQSCGKALKQIYHELSHGANVAICSQSKAHFSIDLSNSGNNGLLIKREGILSDVIHEVNRGSESTEGLPTHRGWGPLHRELAWQASLDGPSSLWPRSQPT